MLGQPFDSARKRLGGSKKAEDGGEAEWGQKKKPFENTQKPLKRKPRKDIVEGP